MDLPGIEVRPIRNMTGDAGFNEVFFTDVRVPAENLIGEENLGWGMAKTTLANERVSLSTGGGLQWGYGPSARDLVAHFRDHGGLADAVARQAVVGAYIEGEILRYHRMRMISAAVNKKPGPDASLRKALADPHGKRVFTLAKDLMGAGGMLDDERHVRRGVGPRLPVQPRAHRRRRHQRGAAQHHRRTPARPPPRPRRRAGQDLVGDARRHRDPAAGRLEPVTIEVTLLGTGNPLPDRDRAGAATLVRASGHTLLVDAGRAVCMRLVAAGVLPLMLDAVLVTHLHSDHICDLNDVVTTQWVMSPAPKPLRIFGPPRIAEVVDAIRAMLAPDVGYRIAHHADLTWEPQLDVVEVPPGVVFEHDGVRVVAARTDHRPVEPTLGYRIEAEGKAVVLAGDTVPCAGLDDLCRGADIYVQTVLRDDLVRKVPMPRFVDTIDYHSTVAQAAQTATRGGVGTLVLTHQVPTPGPDAADEWIAIAREHFSGEIVFGADLVSISA